MKDRIQFLDLKVPIFINKKNGQVSISLPKKKIREIMILKGKDVPKRINIRLEKVNLNLKIDKK